jgi:hypothetical protein
VLKPVLDGRFANNGWLQELPKPLTKLTWDNAALMSPVMAKHLGVANGDLINIAITETTKDANKNPIRRELVIAALISPGHADNSISISLGYGRKKTGPVGEEAGFNGFLLRTSSNPHYIAVDGKTVEAITVTTSPTPKPTGTPTPVITLRTPPGKMSAASSSVSTSGTPASIAARSSSVRRLDTESTSTARVVPESGLDSILRRPSCSSANFTTRARPTTPVSAGIRPSLGRRGAAIDSLSRS